MNRSLSHVQVTRGAADHFFLLLRNVKILEPVLEAVTVADLSLNL